MISRKFLVLPRPCFRQLSTLWERRIDDFAPVHIQSNSNVHVQQYDWRADCVEPKTKLIIPKKGVTVTHTDKLEICNTQSEQAITAQIPIKSPLFVNCSGAADVDVTGHESDITIKAGSGKCILKSVKCANTSIISKGDVELNSIVSNCSVMTSGNLTATKIQGENLTVSSSKGSIHIESLYAPESLIFGKYGDIKLDSVHGSCKIVTATGSVTIGASQDNLDIIGRGGSMNVTLQEIDRSVSIQSFGGSVKLYLSEEVCAKCALTIQTSGSAKVTDEVQTLVNQNEDASAVVYVNVYDAPTFVGKAKSWGEDMWDKLKKKQ